MSWHNIRGFSIGCLAVSVLNFAIRLKVTPLLWVFYAMNGAMLLISSYKIWKGSE